MIIDDRRLVSDSLKTRLWLSETFPASPTVSESHYFMVISQDFLECCT